MAEAKEVKAPEIHDIDLTAKLLAIATASGGDASLRAIHQAARQQLGTINATMQEQYNKVNAAAAKATADAEAKAAEEAKAAQRKAEDEAAAAAKKAAAHDEPKPNRHV